VQNHSYSPAQCDRPESWQLAFQDPASVDALQTAYALNSKIETASNRIFMLFVTLLIILAVSRVFFNSTFTSEVFGHVAALYFLGFTMYRTYFGLGMHPVAFLLVTSGYLAWALYKNVNSYMKLCATCARDLDGYRRTLYEDMSSFNYRLYTYFLLVCGPLSVNLASNVFIVYTEGLTIGLSVTSEMLLNSLTWLEQAGYLIGAFLNAQLYLILSLLWSRHLFNLNKNTFHKLVAGFACAPLLILIQLLLISFMGIFFKVYLFLFIIIFLTLCSALLNMRFSLSTAVGVPYSLFALKALMWFYLMCIYHVFKFFRF